MAVRFDAATDAYTDTTGLLAAGSSLTVTCWFYLSVEQEFQTIFSLDDGSGGYALSVTGVEDDEWYLWDEAFATISAGAPVVGVWTQLAVVVDGSSWSIGMAPQGSSVSPTTASRGTLVANTQLNIATNVFGEWFDGRIASFKMWDAALTSTEIDAEFTQNAPVRTSNLTRYYSFETAPGTADESGNANNLTAGSTATTTETGPGIPGGGGVTGSAIVRTGSTAGARVLDPIKSSPLGVTGGTGQARGIEPSKALALGRVGSDGTAQPLGTAGASVLGRAGGITTARGLAGAKLRGLNRAGSSADAGAPFGAAKQSTIELAGSTSGARVVISPMTGIGRPVPTPTLVQANSGLATVTANTGGIIETEEARGIVEIDSRAATVQVAG